ncbi:MAG: rRNA maturation RNase YbeY [Defluviitaleaceae bacterium]|nr:rRNA maturation RNase YbeY [Defluviitaleaceae bacterium]
MIELIDHGTVTIHWDEMPISDAHRNLLTHAINVGVANIRGKDFASACEVSISFAPIDAMREMNQTYRGKDSETDVLSFPGFANSPALGDIVICPEVAERQAVEYGHTYERELAFLTVHGLLHLLGYDHVNEADEKQMHAKQDEIMGIIGVQR